jgi:hypothetical protein
VDALVRADVVRIDAMFAKGVAVVGADDDRRVVQDALAIQLVQDYAHIVIGVGDRRVVASHHVLEILAGSDRARHEREGADAVPELPLGCERPFNALVGLDSRFVGPRLLHRDSLESICPRLVHLVAAVHVPVVDVQEVVLATCILLEPAQ